MTFFHINKYDKILCNSVIEVLYSICNSHQHSYLFNNWFEKCFYVLLLFQLQKLLEQQSLPKHQPTVSHSYLDISVDNVVVVAVAQRLQDLPHVVTVRKKKDTVLSMLCQRLLVFFFFFFKFERYSKISVQRKKKKSAHLATASL